KKGVARAIEEVARSLGNTPTVCRQCYVHPGIIDAYLDGTMVRAARQRVAEELARDTPGSITDTEERAVLRLLHKRLSQAQSETGKGGRQTSKAG
ncbi:MAG: DNA topoisomerase IB, partial [Chloroflexi bacterium]|nr:DNA topoisomerase IB [Chloroflexota bacterium]